MRVRLLQLFVITCVTACAGPDPSTTDTGALTDGLAISGDYTDDFGTIHAITETTWTQTYPGYEPLVFHVASYDNVEQSVVAQNDESNAFAATLWSRFDWAKDGVVLAYCQSAFDAADEGAAWAADRPGADWTTGCGGFPWTVLTP